MTIRYKPTFEFEGSEAENIRQGISFLQGMVSQLSMTDTRRLVSSLTGGSYARFTELFMLGEDGLSLTQEHAETLVALANNVCSDAGSQDVRKLRTWLDALLSDMKSANETSKLEKEREQQKPLANAS